MSSKTLTTWKLKKGNEKIKKVNKEFYLGVAFDVTCKADNHILSNILKVSGMIGFMVRNFISRYTNNLFKIYKILIKMNIEHRPGLHYLNKEIDM